MGRRDDQRPDLCYLQNPYNQVLHPGAEEEISRSCFLHLHV